MERSEIRLDHIFAVETAEKLAVYQAFVQRTEDRLRRYISVLTEKYAVEDYPRTSVWRSRKTATEREHVGVV